MTSTLYTVDRPKFKPDEEEPKKTLQCASDGKYYPRTYFHLNTNHSDSQGVYKIRGKISKLAKNPTKISRPNHHVERLELEIASLKDSHQSSTASNEELQRLIISLNKRIETLEQK